MVSRLTHLTDEALVAETRRVADLERRSTAELLALLIEFEQRALHLALGYPSMFVYCTRSLLLSEQAAFKRITAARAARRYPVILEQLAEGDLTLSSVRILAPHLTDENVEGLLEAARHKSTREVEQLIAAVHPQPDIPPSVRALPASKAADVSRTEAPGLLASEPRLPETNSVVAVVQGQPASARPLVAPIAPGRYLLKVTVSQETHERLKRAQALLRHTVPDGDLATILDRALTLLVREAERTKWASTQRPRPPHAASTHRRYVPASVKRAVWARDAGCCAFVGPAGRCAETAFLEFHHVVPFSAGGKTEEANLELRCRAHNQHESPAAKSERRNSPRGELRCLTPSASARRRLAITAVASPESSARTTDRPVRRRPH